MITAPSLMPLVKAILEESLLMNVPVWLVGGAVRDVLWGAEIQEKDLDFVLEGDAHEFSKRLTHRWNPLVPTTLQKHPQFGTVKICFKTPFFQVDEVDFASARSEVYESPGKLPRVTRASLTQDLQRRDFTINAMAIAIADLERVMNKECGPEEVLIDPTGGRADLANRVIRILHEKSFFDDPTRLFRGCRYKARLCGHFDEETEHAARFAVDSGVLRSISRFRVFTEIRKGFVESRRAECVECYTRLGLLEGVGPIAVQQLVAEQLIASNDYDTFLDALFALLPLPEREGFARDLNISKKEASERVRRFQGKKEH